jgi:hypothetical protein
MSVPVVGRLDTERGAATMAGDEAGGIPGVVVLLPAAAAAKGRRVVRLAAGVTGAFVDTTVDGTDWG